MSIALVTNFKDEVANAEHVYNCVCDDVDEWIVVDSGSTDGTQERCRELGAHVYQIPHVYEYRDVSGLWCPGRMLSGYGDLRTLDKWLAKKHNCDWCLILDGDERMLPDDAMQLPLLAETPYDFIWLPRQHYRAADMSICENPDISVHPDFQPRFFRTRPELYFERRVHEIPHEKGMELVSLASPVIRHFGWLKSDERKKAIVDMCNILWEMETNPETRETYKKWNAAIGRTDDAVAEQLQPADTK